MGERHVLGVARAIDHTGYGGRSSSGAATRTSYNPAHDRSEHTVRCGPSSHVVRRGWLVPDKVNKHRGDVRVESMPSDMRVRVLLPVSGSEPAYVWRSAGIGTGTDNAVAPAPVPPSQVFGGCVVRPRVEGASAAQNMKPSMPALVPAPFGATDST